MPLGSDDVEVRPPVVWYVGLRLMAAGSGCGETLGFFFQSAKTSGDMVTSSLQAFRSPSCTDAFVRGQKAEKP